MKKAISIILTLAMVLTIGITALAAGEVVSATIQGVSVPGAPFDGEGGATQLDAATLIPVALTTTEAEAADVAPTFSFAGGASLVGVKYYATLTIDTATIADTYSGGGVDFSAGLAGGVANNSYIIVLDDDNNYAVFHITVGAGGGAGSTGSETITGDGDTQYIDLEIYSVVLPTSANLDFTLDPQGLLSIPDGQSVDVADLVGGGIISTATPRAINNSSVPIALSIALTGTGNATFVNTVAAVEANTNTNVLLYAVPSSVNIPTVATDYAASGRGYPVADTASTLTFVLDAAEYEVTNTGGSFAASVKPGTGSGTAIQLGGRVNTTANWGAYTGSGATQSVGISAVYSYAKATETQIGTETIEGIPGMISPTTGHVAVVPAGPSATASLATNASGALLTVNASGFDFPASGYTVRGYSLRDNTELAITTAVVSGSGSSITVQFNAAWTPGGTHLPNSGAAYYLIDFAGYTVRVNLPAGNATTVGTVVVTVK